LEKSESLIQINRSILQQNDDLKNEAHKMHQMSVDFSHKNREVSEIINQLDGVKVDYKKMKLELLEIKAKLITLNTNLMGQIPPLDESQQKIVIRYKDELAKLDYIATALDKKLSQLDVLLAKLAMMHEKNSPQQINFNFQTTQKDHETRESIFEIQKSLGSDEEKIIDYFKSLHLLMRQDISKNSMVRDTKAIESESLFS
jgi:hypothetical protein